MLEHIETQNRDLKPQNRDLNPQNRDLNVFFPKILKPFLENVIFLAFLGANSKTVT